ncbi:MAG: class I SAM-dependent methyltransferase [Candidatus Diapherotrites archaeon]|nr:class I SAM-dependent methyltransferase [Candidatus Diapherotrites archaeon]
MDEQSFYYESIAGMLLGNKLREESIREELKKIDAYSSFVEIGCAQGHFLELAQGKGAFAFGLDYSHEFLQRASKKNPTGLVNADAAYVPFKNSSFDFVLCTEVLEHVPEWKNALHELKRIAKNRILITIPLEKGFFWRIISIFSPMHRRGHLHRLDSQDIEREMSDWRLEKKTVIATPSKLLNRTIAKLFGEKNAIYSVLLFKKA